MTKFTSIESWLKTNPSKAELTKVLNVINKSQVSILRKEMYEEEKKLRKLKRGFVYLQQAELPVPKELEQKIEASQKKVAELRKVVPVIKVNRKKPVAAKVEEPKIEETVVDEPAAEETV